MKGDRRKRSESEGKDKSVNSLFTCLKTTSTSTKKSRHISMKKDSEKSIKSLMARLTSSIMAAKVTASRLCMSVLLQALTRAACSGEASWAGMIETAMLSVAERRKVI